MKKRHRWILMLLALCSAALLTGSVAARRELAVEARVAALQEDLAGEVFRFHVIANSDSEEDQELKLKVRDEIIKKTKSLQESQSIEDSREYLQTHLKDMEETANKVIEENGKSYKAEANLGIRWIPEKTYGDMYFPAGNYEALNLTLGRGEGQNWWCVLFPPLCLIEEDEEAIKEMGISEEQKIEIKWKLMDILKEK